MADKATVSSLHWSLSLARCWASTQLKFILASLSLTVPLQVISSLRGFLLPEGPRGDLSFGGKWKSIWNESIQTGVLRFPCDSSVMLPLLFFLFSLKPKTVRKDALFSANKWKKTFLIIFLLPHHPNISTFLQRCFGNLQLPAFVPQGSRCFRSCCFAALIHYLFSLILWIWIPTAVVVCCWAMKIRGSWKIHIAPGLWITLCHWCLHFPAYVSDSRRNVL